MKKKPILIALCSILILAVAVVAIIKFTGFANKPDGSTDTMELNEVSGYVLEKGYTQEQIEEKLKGEFRNDIIASWGEPDGMLSGFWGVDHAIDLIDGNYIYEVVARWNNSKEYSGVAHYSFYTVMGNYEQIPVGE